MQYVLQRYQLSKIKLNNWIKIIKKEIVISIALISEFNEKKDILVIPKKLNLNHLPVKIASMIKGWERNGKVIRIEKLDRPAIIRSR